MRELEHAEGSPIVGDVIAGKYRIENVAGEGGMGIVYEAEHVILRKRVAVKALPPGAAMSAEAIERFSLEASAIARIASEHVVRVMDAGLLPDGTPYLVMEYLDGCDLAELLSRRGPMRPATVVDYALQALEALSHAHAAHIIHRDLKPANLFLARTQDGRDIVKLVDFGIAKSFDLGSDDRIVGSPTYMSPEQLENAQIDGRTDLWSLGVVMYELLSGAPPFTGSFSQLVTAIRQHDPVPLHRRVPSISADLSNVIGRCLARDPGARWATTAELARALLPHGTGAQVALLPRIERALSLMAEARTPRRFTSVENALQALEAEWRGKGVEVHASRPVTNEPTPARKAIGAEALGDTIPAPSSGGAGPSMMSFSSATPVPPSSRQTLRILLIDDSELVLSLHRHLLTLNGFDVRTTTSVDEFEALLDTWRPHLVVMDVQMPGTSGDVLCARVKARFRASVPVVLVSELPPEVLAEHARIAGADAFMPKTADWARFVDFVRNICAITYSPEDLP